MEFDLVTIWTIASTVFMALWAILKVVAPYTKTDKDDKLVKIISKLIDVFNIKVSNSKVEIVIKE